MQPVESAFSTLIEGARQKPIGRVTIYDTAKTVPSLGFKVAFYTLNNNEAVTSPSGDWWDDSDAVLVFPASSGDLDNIIEPSTLMSFDWAISGSPGPIGQSHLFAIKWSGFFFARYGGVYRFYLDTAIHSRLRVKFNGAYLNMADQDYMADRHTATFAATGKTITASNGTPYSVFSAGDAIVVTGTANNDGVYTIDSISSNNRVITVIAGDTLVDESAVTTTVIGKRVTNWTNTLPAGGTTKELYAETATLTKGNWYEIFVEFWVPETKIPLSVPTFLCVKYREPLSATTDYNEWAQKATDAPSNEFWPIVTDYASDQYVKVLSAGVVSCSKPDGTLTGVTTANVGFLTGSVLTQVHSIEGARSIDEAAEYTVSVPIPNATTLVGGSTLAIIVQSVDGFPSEGRVKVGNDTFRYVSKNSTANTFNLASGETFVPGSYSAGDPVSLVGAGDYPHNPSKHSFGVIKPMRLCRIQIGYEGFESPTAIKYYTDRIWGFVYPNPEVTRHPDGTDIIQVGIQDFRLLLLTDYFRNYPDWASYAGARYYSDYYLSQPNGITRPTAYDRWIVERAARDILMKAGVDPIVLYARQRKAANGGANFANDYGDYLVRGTAQLDYKMKYGNPMTGDENNADEQYNWFFGYGKFLIEGISELMQNFLFRFGFTNDGKALFSPINLPSTRLNDTNDMGGVVYSNYAIQVTSPNGGESWVMGTTQTITWNSNGSGNVKIELYWQYYMPDENRYSVLRKYTANDNGDITTSTADDGSYSWAIPTNLPADWNGETIKWKIRITELDDASNYDYSDDGFTLLGDAS